MICLHRRGGEQAILPLAVCLSVRPSVPVPHGHSWCRADRVRQGRGGGSCIHQEFSFPPAPSGVTPDSASVKVRGPVGAGAANILQPLLCGGGALLPRDGPGWGLPPCLGWARSLPLAFPPAAGTFAPSWRPLLWSDGSGCGLLGSLGSPRGGSCTRAAKICALFANLLSSLASSVLSQLFRTLPASCTKADSRV